MENSAQENNQDQTNKLIQEEILFSWKEYERPFERKSREFYLNTGAILAVISLIIFIAEGWVPVILLIAFSFLYYVMHTIEPRIIDYYITNFGLKIQDKTISWNDIYSFWIEERENYNKLALLINFIPGKIDIVTKKEDKEKIESIMKQYAVNQPIPPSRIEKILGWFSSKIESKNN
jgi:hypothetical protein